LMPKRGAQGEAAQGNEKEAQSHQESRMVQAYIHRTPPRL